VSTGLFFTLENNRSHWPSRKKSIVDVVDSKNELS
jgi:hypothetical protein